ncbi:MAG: DUF2341 domain-containing protein, partial [Thermodesulfovibrionales bacterium]
MRRSLLTLVAIVAAGVLCSASAYGVSWLDPAWSDRISVTVSNPGQSDLTDYQVQITLGSSFPFSSANSDGSDIRVTAADGVTLIPFWIETWTPGTQQGSLWTKVPEIPAVGTTVFLYYGNPSAVASPPVAMEGPPPLGPLTKAPGNPIVPIGDPGAGQNLLAENMVYDSVTQHYWLVFSNYRGEGGVGLVWSDSPTDPTSWNWYGNVYNNPGEYGGSFAPCLVQYNGTWYLFFSDWSGPLDNPHSIVVSTATSVTGPYSAPTVVLSPTPGTWENWRVDEPYVFQRNDGMWIMMYMADSTTGDNPASSEQVGYAYADNILGPYTKYAGNPVLAFGSPGSIDAGTVADPWVVQCPGQYCWQGAYYIGYTASPASASPWQTAYATTTDWQTFTKHGILLPESSSGWDATNSFRGAVYQVGETYVLSYTGGVFEMGIATQPVVSTAADIINNPESVFDFYDDFAGTVLDSSKWSFASGSSSQAVEAGGTLTLTGTGASLVAIESLPTFGTNYIVEAHAQHPQQGVLNMVAEVGLSDSSFGDMVRIVDDYPSTLPTSTTTWNRQAKLSGQLEGNWNAMAEASDQQWHIFSVYRQGSDVAGFQIDQNPVESVTSNVPTSNLSAYLMSYSAGADNQVVADWIRVRKFVSPQPVAALDPVNSITISPSTASIITGGSQSYTAQAFDQYGNSMGFVTGSTSFTISPDGSCTGATCTASVTGAHTVTGTYSGMSSLPASLQVNLGAPTQVSPSGIIATATPTYTWAAVPGATSYTLYLDNGVTMLRDDTFSASANCSSGSCSAPTTVALTDATSYYWTVEASNAAGSGPWAAGMQFTVLTDTVPGAPTQQAPSGIIATATPTYTWAAVPGATSYTLYLDNGVTMLRYDTFSASANCSSGTCSAPTTVALTDATSYYWTVEASNAAGSAWAAGMQFTVLTDTVPGAPTQQAPSGIIATATPTYTWAAVPGATSYTLYLDNGVTMLRYDTFSASANCSSGTCSAPTTVALTDATSYYWTVEASNAAGNAWAAGMQFTVITDTIPGAPTQQAPSGVISTATPTYTWAAVPGATSYTLYLDNNVTRLRDDPFSASAICSSGTCSVPTIVALPESGMGGFLVEAAEGGSIAPQTAGTAFGITITARDQNNNIIPTFSGTVNLSTNTGSITPV